MAITREASNPSAEIVSVKVNAEAVAVAALLT
jgi:hypothetical protein